MSQLTVEILETRLLERWRDHCRVQLLWRFSNRADHAIWLLLTPPRVELGDEKQVLDHSATSDLDALYFNQPPRFDLLEIGPDSATERWLEAKIVIDPASTAVAVAGRFGFGDSTPGADWVERQNWQRVAEWQQIAESVPVTIELPESEP